MGYAFERVSRQPNQVAEPSHKARHKSSRPGRSSSRAVQQPRSMRAWWQSVRDPGPRFEEVANSRLLVATVTNTYKVIQSEQYNDIMTLLSDTRNFCQDCGMHAAILDSPGDIYDNLQCYDVPVCS